MATSTDLEQTARSLTAVHANRTEAVEELLRLADGGESRSSWQGNASIRVKLTTQIQISAGVRSR